MKARVGQMPGEAGKGCRRKPVIVHFYANLGTAPPPVDDLRRQVIHGVAFC